MKAPLTTYRPKVTKEKMASGNPDMIDLDITGCDPSMNKEDVMKLLKDRYTLSSAFLHN